MMKNLKALPVNVYKNEVYDCTNNGLSSKFSRLKIMGDGIKNVPFEIDENEDYLVCEYRERFNDYIAIPKSIIDSKQRSICMFGGNFVYTSDSRFPSNSPIKIFDRIE